MNLPNKLTLARVALIPVVITALYLPGDGWRYAAAALFAAGCVTDWLDGYIARSRKLVTDFGRFLDPVADKLLVLSTLAMLVSRGQLPAWALIVILARELTVDGLRMVAVGQGRVIAAGMLGKIKTTSQMALVLWLLLSDTAAFGHPVSIVLTCWVLAITLWSGVDYLWKNRDVFLTH